MATNSATTSVSGSSSSTTVQGDNSTFLSSIGSVFETIPDVTLPMPNVLHSYATYNYILSIGVLTDEEINHPDESYFANKKIPLICKSGNADPANRVKTDYGRFDFFIDNLEIHGIIGHEQGNNTNSTMISFEITEPFSMGLFTIACHTAAIDAGHKNWRECPFLLRIDFRGNNEYGTMSQTILDATRFIPFKFTQISMSVKETGSVYQCRAMAWNQAALTTKHATLKTDMSINGKTVQEILQTGEKSLQAMWNKRLHQLKDAHVIEVPDEIVIIFPEDVASEGSSGSSSNSNGATTGTAGSDVITKLGLTRSKTNNTLVQDEKKCNLLGKAKLGFDATTRPPDAPFGKDNGVYDEKTKGYVRANNTPTVGDCDFRFRQDTDIPNAINQVLIQSDFPNKALDPKNMSPEGYKKWWKIDVQVYNVSTDANYKSTGTKPKIVVYRVIPYNVHGSSAPSAPNKKAAGFDELYKQAYKRYNYIYTGKNIDVLKFDITIANTFAVLLSADASTENQDVSGGKVALEGQDPELTPGVIPTEVSYSSTGSNIDKKGGGGRESYATRAAKMFHDTINTGNDLIMLNLEILGDPGWIAQSGLGNYTSKQTQYPNLNKDRTVNYQSGEVDIIVNFRTPIDINNDTGMYNFNGKTPTTPVMSFSGLYRINQITSNFRSGVFTQTIKGQRRNQQEATHEGTSDHGLSTDSISSAAKQIGSTLKKLGNLF